MGTGSRTVALRTPKVPSSSPPLRPLPAASRLRPWWKSHQGNSPQPVVEAGWPPGAPCAAVRSGETVGGQSGKNLRRRSSDNVSSSQKPSSLLSCSSSRHKGSGNRVS